MADYPCDIHLSRYSGPSVRTYVNIFREELAIRLKLSICSACLQAVVSDWLGHAVHQTAEGHWDPVGEDQDLETLWEASERPEKGLRAVRR